MTKMLYTFIKKTSCTYVIPNSLLRAKKLLSAVGVYIWYFEIAPLSSNREIIQVVAACTSTFFLTQPHIINFTAH